MPVEVRHLVPQQLHVDVVRPANLHERSHRGVQVLCVQAPFGLREFIGPGRVARVVDQDAVAPVGLVPEEVHRGRAQLHHDVSLIIRLSAWRVERTAFTRCQLKPGPVH